MITATTGINAARLHLRHDDLAGAGPVLGLGHGPGRILLVGAAPPDEGEWSVLTDMSPTATKIAIFT
jgi:hypothetical protein